MSLRVEDCQGGEMTLSLDGGASANLFRPQHLQAQSLQNEVFDGDIVAETTQLLWAAIHQKASDIHIEPYPDFYRIRLRLDGLLHEWQQCSSGFAYAFIARLKALANLDVSEKRLAQDGHFSLGFSASNSGGFAQSISSCDKAQAQLRSGVYQSYMSTETSLQHSRSLKGEGHQIDFRLSTCPTVSGEKVVVRILNSNRSLISIQSLGLTALQESIFLNALNQPQGLILMIGPTGCGKTVTLYAALHYLNPSLKNILTIEDPVEIYQPGINQVNINKKAGITFANGLRAFLRQDPDVMMIGEIRDVETAQIVTRATQTGHLILSTLHAKNTVQALDRLLSLELTQSQICSNLLLLVAQRLVRKLCVHCKKQVDHLPEIFLEQNHKGTVFTADRRGCQFCHAGYRDRIGIFELLPMTQDVVKKILQKNYRFSLNAFLQKQYFSLRSAGLQKVLEGVTSLEEVDRVVPVSF